MPKQFRDPKLRSADFALDLLATTADHVRVCPRCYEILVRKVGEKLDVYLADVRNLYGPHSKAFLLPTYLWPLLGETYSAFAGCENWPGLKTPN